MKITLVRTGGMLPVTKKSNTEVDWSTGEMDELINSTRVEDSSGQMRDNTQYQLLYNDETFPISLEKIPEKYKKTFDNLKNSLQIVKPG